MPLDESAEKARAGFSNTPPGDPVCACTPSAPSDPSYETPTVPADLQPDAQGVYGFTPKPGTQFASSPPWPDWTDPQQVAAAREVRLGYHQGLADEVAWVDGMRQKGVADEDIARQLVDIRNQTRMSKYAEDKLPMLYERNEREYGNKFGPSYESLLDKYGSADQVIKAGTRSNAAMDVLTGVASVSKSTQ